MDRGSYIAGNGMIAQQQRLDVLANNLANVNTQGFKADRLTFGDMMRRTLADDAGYGDTIATLSSGPEVNKGVKVTDFTEGGSQHTDNPLDVRLGGKTLAIFAVGHAGATRYTRDGAFTLDARGSLVTKAGDPVLDDAGKPITGLTDLATIDKTGSVTMNGKPVARIGTVVGTFTKDGNGGGLYEGSAVRASTDRDGVQIASGQLETSNVDAVGSMVEMIALQRSYEISQKMVQSQDESTAKLAEAMG